MDNPNRLNHETMIKRLDGFYGAVCERQNRGLAEEIIGRKVLEVGCGYGTLLDLLRKKGFHAIGIDMDKEAIKLGRQRYKDINLIYMDVNSPEFHDEKFDCVIFRESAHHLDFDIVLTKLEKFIAGQIIVFEPNPNFLVKICRKVVGHTDSELDYRKTTGLLNRHNFKIKCLEFSDTIAFPFSGGFVGKPLLPNIKLLWIILLKVDEILLKVLNLLRLKKYLCWRYMIVAARNP
jgi:SAM-dependent methyltransferase